MTIREAIARAISRAAFEKMKAWNAASRENGMPVRDPDRPLDASAWMHEADAVLSAIEAAGFQVVPVEATRAMCVAAAGETAAFKGTGAAHAFVKRIWRAMLSAAKEDQP